MSTVTKTFAFINDTEGWYSPENITGVAMSFRYGGYAKGRRSWAIEGWGGYLHTFAGVQNTTIVNPFWEWDGSWEDLGIPSNSIITSVYSQYCYRVIMHSRHSINNSHRTNSTLLLSDTDASVGPLSLYKADVNKGVLAVLDNVPARTSEDMWSQSPLDNSPRGVGSNGWNGCGGTLTIPSDTRVSNTAIKLRLNMLIPNTLTGYIHMRFTQISLQMTYYAASSPVSNALFIGSD